MACDSVRSLGALADWTRSLFGCRAWPGALACALMASVGMGCAEEDCVPLEVCDIRDHGCQDSVARAMACMRGGGSASPALAVEVTSEEEFLRQTYREPSAEQARDGASWTEGLAFFHLSAPEVDSEALAMEVVSNISAAYLRQEGRIVVIDRGASMRSEEAVVTLAHEMIHAMQDAEFDLEAQYERAGSTFDGALALRALIEGEATHYGNLARAQLRGWDPADLDWMRFYARWQSGELEQAEADAQPLDMAMLRFPYAFGGAFATRVWLARGPQGLRAMFERPPRATREILFGAATTDLDVERQALDAFGAPVLPTGFEPVTRVHLGAWIARIFAARMDVPVASRWVAPQALGADVLSVYRNRETDQLVASWRIRLLPEAAAGSWPVSQPPIEGWSDEVRREVFLVAQSPGGTIAPRSLAWQELPPEQMAAAMDSAMNLRGWRPEIRLDCLARSPQMDRR